MSITKLPVTHEALLSDFIEKGQQFNQPIEDAYAIYYSMAKLNDHVPLSFSTFQHYWNLTKINSKSKINRSSAPSKGRNKGVYEPYKKDKKPAQADSRSQENCSLYKQQLHIEIDLYSSHNEFYLSLSIQNKDKTHPERD